MEAYVECTESEVSIHTSFAGAPRGFGLHVDEYLLALLLSHSTRGAFGGSAVHPSRVWLISARPHGELPAYGTTEIEFGAATTGLALTRNDAERAFPSFDPMLVAVADQIASAALAHAPRPNALATTVAAKIESLLPGDASADAIAAALKMSARTLQRRLEEEGIRFSTVLDETRSRVAKKLLADPKLALAEVAYKIGFSDLATFSRAFKRWTGVPPGTFRRRTAPRSPAS
jgi:AraC-like DNA-binding protein